MLNLLFAGVVTFLSSCFDFTEEITINEDGSGKYETIMDAKKFAEQMQSLAAFNTNNETEPQLKNSLDSSFDETIKKYNSVRGVTNVVADTSEPNIYKLSMNFSNVDALNQAIYLSNNDEGMKNLYSFQKGQLTRKDNKLNFGDVEDESELEMMKEMMKDNKYTIIINVPGKIKSLSNKDAKISDDKKSVRLVCSLTDLIDKYAGLGLDVRYK